MGGGTEQRGGFGADVSAAQFVRLAVALMMGTLVECEYTAGDTRQWAKLQ